MRVNSPAALNALHHQHYAALRALELRRLGLDDGLSVRTADATPESYVGTFRISGPHITRLPDSEAAHHG